ncbi:MAG: ligand-binding sensor domain-containing protein [Saprospiraceae bacterium]
MKTIPIIVLSALALLFSCKGQDTKRLAYDKIANIAKGDRVSVLGNDLMNILQDKNNIYWFGSWTDGVYRYDPGTTAGHKKSIAHFTTKDGLCDNKIEAIQTDKSGNIYFTTGNGISQFDGKRFKTLEPSSASTSDWKLQTDDLWFKGAQDSGVVYRYDGSKLYRLKFPKTKAGEDFIAKYPRSQNPFMTYNPYDVYKIYKDRKGNVWFGTSSLGICRYDGKKHEWMYEKHLSELEGAGSFGIRSILQDEKGKFWFCNTKYRYNIEKSESDKSDSIHYRREKGIENLVTKDGKDFTYFMSIIEDKNGEIWMADRGVWRFNNRAHGKGQQLTFYPTTDADKIVSVFSIYQDNFGDIWLGTHEHGVYKFNGKAFERFMP